MQNVKLSALKSNQHSEGLCINDRKIFDACLIFGAGPNASSDGKSTGSMQRTRNELSCQNYEFFKECVKCALRAKFDAGILAGVTVFVVDLTSCGIYAGSHLSKMEKDYENIVTLVINETVGPNGKKRWQYINYVVIAYLQ